MHNTNVVMSLNWFKRKKVRSGAYLFNYFSSLRKKISKKINNLKSRTSEISSLGSTEKDNHIGICLSSNF